MTAVAKPPDGGWGWVIVVCSFLIHVIIDGITYAFGVLAAEFVVDLGSSRQLNGWITSVLVGVTLGAGPLVSAICDKFGNRAVTISGAVVASVGLAVSYFVTQPWMFILTISLITGFGVSLIYLPAIVTVGIYFDKRRSMAIGIAVCGSGLGIFAFGPFIDYLIDLYTWRGAMLILAGIMLNSAVFGTLLRPLPPAATSDEAEQKPLVADAEAADGSSAAEGRQKQQQRQQQAGAGEFRSLQSLNNNNKGQRQRTFSEGGKALSPEAPTPEQLQPPAPALLASRSAFIMTSVASLARPEGNEEEGNNDTKAADTPAGKRNPAALSSIRRRMAKILRLELMRDPAFLLFIVSNLLFNIGFDAPFLYTPDRAQQAGHSTKMASLLFSVIGIANLVGRLVFGFVADQRRVNKSALYACALSIAGVALFFSFISSSYAFMATYCALFGLFVGAYVTLTPAVLADLLGADKLNDSFGLTLLFQGVGVLAGPPVAGALFDSTHNFDISYMASGSCMMLSGIILFPLPCLLRWQAAKKAKTPCSQPVTTEL